MIPRLTARKLRGLSGTDPGRRHLQTMLETQQAARESLCNLIDLGAGTSKNVQDLADVDHNITLLRRALGEVAA